MPKTIIDSRGLVQVPGRGVEIREVTVFEGLASFAAATEFTGSAAFSGSAEFSGSAVMRRGIQSRPRLITASQAVGQPGLYFITSSNPVTCALRDPGSPAMEGGDVIIRNLGSSPWMLTCSAVPHSAIVGPLGPSQPAGTSLVMPPEQDNSVMLRSDGWRWMVLNASGAFGIS
jgi:hypothetical protein